MDIELSMPEKTASQYYGFSDIEVGETFQVTLKKASARGESLIKVRLHIGAHAQYYEKKFKTRIIEDVLYAKRVK